LLTDKVYWIPWGTAVPVPIFVNFHALDLDLGESSQWAPQGWADQKHCLLEVVVKVSRIMVQALGMLFWHKHDLDRATQDLANFTPFPDEWSVEDKVLFEQAFQVPVQQLS
jgi:hypothetical protein